jgi:hypothetical protein
MHVFNASRIFHKIDMLNFNDEIIISVELNKCERARERAKNNSNHKYIKERSMSSCAIFDEYLSNSNIKLDYDMLYQQHTILN